MPAVDLLVVDDNSPDGTGRWCDDRAAEDPRVRCLHRAGKLGLGKVPIAAMKYALSNGYGYVLTMDADFSHYAQVPVGDDCRHESARKVRPSTCNDDRLPLHPSRRHRGLVAEAALHELRRELLRPLVPRPEGQGICSGNYRCYRAEALSKLDFDRFRSRGDPLQEEILWRLKRVGVAVRRNADHFVDRRRSGQSKINLKEEADALRIIFSLGMQGLLGL